ncbi:hypothetical protein P7L78_15950 [Tistrella bauzanensis]|uniref:Polymerase nucleotidyl transferase domain-containing protein n=1 Tax=Tistrella arctica TaxID=3133430 RepID=A0ABU9YEM4_9PROT
MIAGDLAVDGMARDWTALTDAAPHLVRLRRRTEDLLSGLAAALPAMPVLDEDDLFRDADTARPPATAGLGVVVCGSYGRGEAGPQADLDSYVLYDPRAAAGKRGDGCEMAARQLAGRVHRAAAIAGIRQPADGGAFEATQSADALINTIGGVEDGNQITTRRLLMLLEGRALAGAPVFRRSLDGLIATYVQDHHGRDDPATFLLNDVIRYYRSICVDFEMKTRGAAAKGWGLRNVKLVFSRKLLYVSGVVAAGETAGLDVPAKRALLSRLLGRPPIDRLLDIYGPGPLLPALARYDRFLAALDDPANRAALDVPPAEARGLPLYRMLKDEAAGFSRDLLTLINSRYPADHPLQLRLVL